MATLPTPTTRTVKGSALTWSELDKNFTDLKTYIDTVLALFDTDGTLMANAVDVSAVLKDRVVSSAKLALDGLPFFADTGTTNALAIAPSPVSSAYADGQVFFIWVGYTNTGATTLAVNALAATPILKAGGEALDAGDIEANSVICVVYKTYGGVAAFRLMAGSGASGGSSSGTAQNWTGLSQYESEDTALPGAGLTATFAHALGQVPSILKVWLTCAVADGTYSVGDCIAVQDIVDDTTGAPAFEVEVTTSAVVVTQISTDLQTPNASLTEASWKLRVHAAITYSEATPTFPALEYTIARPQGAICYGSNLFVHQYGRHQTKSILARINTSTNQLYPLEDPAVASDITNGNMAMFRRASLTDVAIVTCTDSSGPAIYQFPLQDPSPTTWRPELVSLGGLALAGAYRYKPVWLVESLGSITELYCAASSYYAGRTVSSIPLRQITTASEDLTYGTNLNLTHANVGNRTEFMRWYTGTGNAALVIFFAYNPVKGRIYVMTTEVFGVHVFQIAGTTDFKSWWDQVEATRATNLSYVKTLGLPGTGADFGDVGECHIALEFDLGTGTEKSLTFCRPGSSNNWAGTVTRVPWREG